MTTPVAPPGEASTFHHLIGGVTRTGNGHRESGHAAPDTYTEWTSISVDFGGKLRRAQIDRQPAGGVP